MLYARAKSDTSDPLMKVPADNVVIEVIQEKDSHLPKHIALATKIELPHPASDVVQYLTGGRTVVTHKYANLGTYPVNSPDAEFKPAEVVAYEIDHNAGRTTKDSAGKPSLNKLFEESPVDITKDTATALIDEKALDAVALDPKLKLDMQIVSKDLKSEATTIGPRCTMNSLFNAKAADEFDSRTGELSAHKTGSSRKGRKF